MNLTPLERRMVERLSRRADLMPEEPCLTFSTPEMQDAYYELRAQSCGFPSLKALAEERERQMNACDHFASIDADSMHCTFCGEYCGP